MSSDKNTPTSLEAPIKDVFVVLNPVAGIAKADIIRQSIYRFCEKHGWNCQIHETTPTDDLARLVSEAIDQDVDLVIAAGGDGTVSGVVSGMVLCQVPLGILPIGTGNILAHHLGIPMALGEALAVLGGPNKTRVLDVMKINGDYYILNASIGISSHIIKNTGREEKRRFGMLAYVWRGFQSILRSRMHRFEAWVDGRVYRFQASEVMITNTGLFGIPPPFGEITINSDDGRLDLFILRARNFRDYLNILARFVFRRKRSGDRNLRYLEIRDQAVIYTRVPLAVQADGEEIGQTPVELDLIPGALRILAPEGRVAAREKRFR